MFKQVEIQNLRVLQHINLSPSSGLNLIHGANGAGKTSLLEALYVLVYGRSFRHREILPLIRESQDNFQIVAKFGSLDQFQHTLGMLKTKTDLTIRLDGKASIRRSDILNLLPMTWIGSDPQLLLTSTPEKRRAFIDAGLFHVEHHYLEQLQKYHRALDQRNAALKLSSDAVCSWDKTLDEAAEQIDVWRSDYVLDLAEYVLSYMDNWQQPVSLDIQYHRGWSPDISLLEGLNRALTTDKKLKYTTIGIHRADIHIRSRNIKTGKLLSRGQLKMLACAFYFAQVKLLKNKQKTSAILLFDDLSAELDINNRSCLMATLSGLYDQSFITALNKEDICHIRQPDSMFHVEHGQVNKL